MNQLGYFGKIQHRGDFVRFNLPQSFTKVWDDWLQQIILDGEQHHQSEWKSFYDNAPSQHFVLSSGIAGSQIWVGVLLPSQDKVGRRFPFCLAMSLSEHNLPCVTAARLTPWFRDAQSLLSRIKASDYEFDQLQIELGTLAKKYEQSDILSPSPLTITSKPDSDSIGVTIDSSNPLNDPVAAQALLDALLTQTLSEYSIWMCQDGDNQSMLHSGLPTGQSALTLFSGDMQSCSTTSIDLVSLNLSAIALTPIKDHLAVDTQAAVFDDQLGSTVAETPAGALSADSSTVLQDDNSSDTSTQANDILQVDAESDDQSADTGDTADNLNSDNAPQPLSADPAEQSPSADDWAVLEGFKVVDEQAVEIPIPEVEPLELDESESSDTDDAPWET